MTAKVIGKVDLDNKNIPYYCTRCNEKTIKGQSLCNTCKCIVEKEKEEAWVSKE